jgi:homoserine dehydrogenase
LDRALLTRDARAVIADPAVDVIVELIGGTNAARTLVTEALRARKPVVTANKKLLAEHGDEIFGLAEQGGVDLYFGASVGGGIPIIRVLREGLIANQVLGIAGILNGTCNYILTRMENEALPFDAALAAAQAAGYAEADPSLDIDGLDTAHKAVILASLAYGVQVPMSAVYVEGIRGLAKVDIEYARSLGYRLKLLAVVKNDAGAIEARVHPTLIPLDHMLASVSGVFNAVTVEGDIVGQTLYYGRGAGRLPTASAVLSDIADLARRLTSGAAPCGRPPAAAGRFKDMGDVEARYYLRLGLLDKPGVLGQVATVLGQQGISLASVLQKEPQHSGRHVPVVIVTHPARERGVAAALAALEQSELMGGKAVRLRIEDLGVG